MNNNSIKRKTNSYTKGKKPSTIALAHKQENEEDYLKRKLNGRPPKQIDQEIFEGLCRILCTHEQITNVLNVSKKTLNLWIRATYHSTFAKVYDYYASAGKAELTRTLFVMSKDDPKIAMFLARTQLGFIDEKEKRQLEQNERLIQAKIEANNEIIAEPVATKIEFVVKDETDKNRVAKMEQEIKDANK